jgi:hypothetical protein
MPHPWVCHACVALAIRDSSKTNLSVLVDLKVTYDFIVKRNLISSSSAAFPYLGLLFGFCNRSSFICARSIISFRTDYFLSTCRQTHASVQLPSITRRQFQGGGLSIKLLRPIFATPCVCHTPYVCHACVALTISLQSISRRCPFAEEW